MPLALWTFSTYVFCLFFPLAPILSVLMPFSGHVRTFKVSWSPGKPVFALQGRSLHWWSVTWHLSDPKKLNVSCLSTNHFLEILNFYLFGKNFISKNIIDFRVFKIIGVIWGRKCHLTNAIIMEILVLFLLRASQTAVEFCPTVRCPFSFAKLTIA